MFCQSNFRAVLDAKVTKGAILTCSSTVRPQCPVLYPTQVVRLLEITLGHGNIFPLHCVPFIPQPVLWNYSDLHQLFSVMLPGLGLGVRIWCKLLSLITSDPPPILSNPAHKHPIPRTPSLQPLPRPAPAPLSQCRGSIQC